jgi:hypothetical protein
MTSINHDEEHGARHASFQLSINTEASSSDDDDDYEPASDGRFSSILSSEASSFHTYGSENDDHVPELASLMNNGGLASYGSAEDEPLRIMHKRTLSDESIATVAALPGMVLRAHSIMNGKRGNCVIRHSVPKVGEYLELSSHLVQL